MRKRQAVRRRRRIHFRVLPALPLREKCPYSELFWSAFSRIRTEYGEIRSIFPYSVRMRENADQNNSEYGHFLHNFNDQEKDEFNIRNTIIRQSFDSFAQ